MNYSTISIGVKKFFVFALAWPSDYKRLALAFAMHILRYKVVYMVTFTFKRNGNYISVVANTMRWAINLAAKQLQCKPVQLEFVCVAETCNVGRAA